jgi:hypothetical protein
MIKASSSGLTVFIAYVRDYKYEELLRVTRPSVPDKEKQELSLAGEFVSRLRDAAASLGVQLIQLADIRCLPNLPSDAAYAFRAFCGRSSTVIPAPESQHAVPIRPASLSV